MTNRECHVRGCGRHVPESVFVCAEHIDRLREQMLDLGGRGDQEGTGLVHALDAAYLRQQRFSVASITIPNPDESQVPYDDVAGRVRRDLSRTLLRWWLAVRDVTPDSGFRCIGENTPATVEAMTAHLLRYLGWFATNPVGPDVVADFNRVHRKAELAVDRPDDLVYLGVCSWRYERDGQQVECDEDLYGVQGMPAAVCRVCKHAHDVKARQSVLLNSVSDQLASASDIARGLSGLDLAVKPNTISQWHRRKRLVPRGGDDDRPLYRVGDVIDLVLSERQRVADDLRKSRGSTTS